MRILTVQVNAAIFGAFMNQGQILHVTERVIVTDKNCHEFVKKLGGQEPQLTMG